MENDNEEPRKRQPRRKQLATETRSSINPAENNCIPPEQQDNCKVKGESMSIQDVKESKAGSRYSLRSQLKRPINSSEYHPSWEPLTKKPPKASKRSSAVKLMQESEIPIKPRDERVPSEIALNVDLIVESLFRSMDCTTLKSCRLVSRRWKYFGAKELQRRRDITIKLSFSYVIDTSEKSVRSLLTLIKNSDLHTFPCTSFDVSTEELSFPRIRNILSVAEAQNPIKQLSLVLNYKNKKLPWKESTLLEDLEDLLFSQVPNLADLRIDFHLPSHWDDGLNTLDSGFCHLQNSPYLLPRLTSLNLFGLSIPRKLFEDVMNAAVNLQSYDGCHFSPEQLEYFADGNGRHRIHLLKHLSFQFYGSFIEVVERLVTQHGGDLKLKTFHFLKSLTGRLNDGAEFWSRASSVISQLFLLSASTMTCLAITPMRFLPELAIPRLPNLCVIFLVGLIAEDVDYNFFFPFGFSVAKNFPNLSTVSFKWGSPLKSLEMLGITDPVTSVNYIWMTDKHRIDDGTRARLYAAFPSVVLIEERT